MPDLVETLFGGGGGKKATKAQRKENERTREFIEQQQAQARSDVLGLFPGAIQSRNQGFQGALDVLGQTIPQQFSTFQQGNVGAQSALLAGLPQFQNAILGLPTDLSGLQPQTIQFDPSFAQQQLPGVASSGGVSFGQGEGTAGGTPQGSTRDPAGGTAVGFTRDPVGFQTGGFPAPIDPAGQSFNNPFANTFNAGPIDQLFGRQDIGSLAQLGLSEQGGRIGQIAGLLSGIPGLGQLGSFIGDRNIANKAWFSPVDPGDPYGIGPSFAPIQANQGLPSSGLFAGNTAGTVGGFGGGVVSPGPTGFVSPGGSTTAGGQPWDDFIASLIDAK